MSIVTKSAIVSMVETFLKDNPHGVLEILGPTCSGKTDFAIELAKIIQSKLKLQSNRSIEIISVDSRQIFLECNISSAKITKAEMQGIPHHGIDLCSVQQTFSVYEFQQYAFQKITDILKRGNIPILCGGTMLWLDSISENYTFSPEKNIKSDQKGSPCFSFYKIGMYWNREILYNKINNKVKWRFENGLIEETQHLITKYDIGNQAFTSFGYAEVCDFLQNKISYDQALTQNQQKNRNYAKRQLTWWRGRTDITWVQGH